MTHSRFTLILSLLFVCSSLLAEGRQWTLQQCLDYALQNNIQLRQKSISTQSSKEDVAHSKGAFFPSISFSTSQNMNYRPYSKQTISLDGGTMTTTSDAVSYNGNYGLNARWTLFNGGKNIMNLKSNELTEQQNRYAEQETANSIQEQITLLYIQILYETEAIKVNEEILESSRMQLERAKVMVETGSLAKVDQVQLESQVAQDELSLLSAQTQLQNTRLQLKQLLEIHDGNEDFEVAIPDISDEMVLLPIPDQSAVYQAAIENRPEIRAMKLSIENSELSLKTAKIGYVPSISLSGGVGTSNGSAQSDDFATQIKNNLSCTVGVSLSLPIYDNNDARTNVRKAKYAQETAQLQLQDSQKQLYSTIENYYLEATTSQQKYIYAKKNVESSQKSYELVNEQFNLGLKNIVELTTGKTTLLQAQQQLLESKYNAIYNQAMLRFYLGEDIHF